MSFALTGEPSSSPSQSSFSHGLTSGSSVARPRVPGRLRSPASEAARRWYSGGVGVILLVSCLDCRLSCLLSLSSLSASCAISLYRSIVSRKPLIPSKSQSACSARLPLVATRWPESSSAHVPLGATGTNSCQSSLTALDSSSSSRLAKACFIAVSQVGPSYDLLKHLTMPSPPQLMTHLPSGLQTTLQTPSPRMMR